jgi:L-ribulokinase
MSVKYSIGIDYGTESGRAVLVRVSDGAEIAAAVHPYGDGVIDSILPDGKTKLAHDWALQNPMDYIEVIKRTVPAVLKESGVDPADVIGIGTDFTACTMLPIDDQGRPLCALPEFQSEPHAWVKLWKHHAGQPEADMINNMAEARGEDFLQRYGGKISSEWFFSKLLETLRHAPHVYKAADRFLEAADWVILQLTGNERRNACTAGYKAMWEKAGGYPTTDYFKALDPGLENVVADKLSTDIYPLGDKAGELTAEMAELTGLKAGTAVAIGNVDAHVAVPASTVTDVGKLVMIMGTSTCHMLLGKEQKIVEGMCGVVEDGILPGLFGYEAGQSCVGDSFAWYMRTCFPEHYAREAAEKGLNPHALLEEKAAKFAPGESGLIALDWWNGNRSVLVDADLTGVMLGATLSTQPEEMYRALIESTAFGTNTIIQAFESNGIPVNELYACGGLPGKNAMLMQIYADVTGREIKIAKSAQTPALGSAIFGAVAAGAARGGYDTVVDAAEKMAHLHDTVYRPIDANHRVYRRLYEEYAVLHDYFGRGANDIMKRLKKIKAEASGENA